MEILEIIAGSIICVILLGIGILSWYGVYQDARKSSALANFFNAKAEAIKKQDP